MRRRLLTGLAAAAVTLVAGASTVEGGDTSPTRDVTIRVFVSGSQAASAESYVPTVTPNAGGGVVGGSCALVSSTPVGFFTGVEYTCTLMTGDTYTVTAPEPPDPFVVFQSCSDATEILVEGDQLVVQELGVVGTGEIGCFFSITAPTVVLDKVVFGEDPDPPTTSDFVLEIYPAAGGSPVATASDPAAAGCSDPDRIGIDCAYVELPLGDYVIGEQREYGYLPVAADCTSEPGGGGGDPGPIIIEPIAEIIDDPNGAFSLTEVSPLVFCAVINVYAEGLIDVTMTVINDDGGTAGPEDWTAELYDDTSALVIDAACNPDGTCLSGAFPIGEYTVGQVGPDGYTTTVNITITPFEEPDFGDGDPEIIIVPEIIDDPNAVFDLEPFAIVEVEIVNDDEPVPPTTTTVVATTTTVLETTTTVLETTTTIAPTTAVPTTLVTTTAFDAGAGTLPATGDDGTRSAALVAVVLLGLGLAATRFARR